MKLRAIFGSIVFALVLAGIALAAVQRPQLGGYKAASVSDEGVVAAAEFAVSKESETTEGLALDEILKAESQVVAGTNYRLCLKVTLGDESQEVQAVVFRNLKGEHSLTSWTPKECAP
jgi:cystatin-C